MPLPPKKKKPRLPKEKSLVFSSAEEEFRLPKKNRDCRLLLKEKQRLFRSFRSPVSRLEALTDSSWRRAIEDRFAYPSPNHHQVCFNVLIMGFLISVFCKRVCSSQVISCSPLWILFKYIFFYICLSIFSCQSNGGNEFVRHYAFPRKGNFLISFPISLPNNEPNTVHINWE